MKFDIPQCVSGGQCDPFATPFQCWRSYESILICSFIFLHFVGILISILWKKHLSIWRPLFGFNEIRALVSTQTSTSEDHYQSLPVRQQKTAIIRDYWSSTRAHLLSGWHRFRNQLFTRSTRGCDWLKIEPSAACRLHDLANQRHSHSWFPVSRALADPVFDRPVRQAMFSSTVE